MEILWALIGAAAGALVGVVLYAIIRRKIDENAIGSAKTQAKKLLEEAARGAETRKKEALIQAKEEILREKNETENELRERRKEVARQENRIAQKEEALDQKTAALEKRDLALQDRYEAERIRGALEKEKKKLEEEKTKLRQQAKEDARKVVRETREEMETLIKNLRAVEAEQIVIFHVGFAEDVSEIIALASAGHGKQVARSAPCADGFNIGFADPAVDAEGSVVIAEENLHLLYLISISF